MASCDFSYSHLSSLTLVRQNRAALSVGIVSDNAGTDVPIFDGLYNLTVEFTGSDPYSLPERICPRPLLLACAKHFSRRKLHHLRHAKIRKLRNPSVIRV